MPSGNLLYAQSGGVTAVINATAGAVIEPPAPPGGHRAGAATASWALRELYDLQGEDLRQIRAQRTPAVPSVLPLEAPDLAADRRPYERLIEVSVRMTSAGSSTTAATTVPTRP